MEKTMQRWNKSVEQWDETVGILRKKTGYTEKPRKNEGVCRFRNTLRNECSILTVMPDEDICGKCKFHKNAGENGQDPENKPAGNSTYQTPAQSISA